MTARSSSERLSRSSTRRKWNFGMLGVASIWASIAAISSALLSFSSIMSALLRSSRAARRQQRQHVGNGAAQAGNEKAHQDMGVVNPDRGGDAAAWRPSRNERQKPHGRPSSAVIVRHKHHRPPLVGRRWKLARPARPSLSGLAGLFFAAPAPPRSRWDAPVHEHRRSGGPSTAENLPARSVLGAWHARGQPTRAAQLSPPGAPPANGRGSLREAMDRRTRGSGGCPSECFGGQ
jgi:hypothetical protein